LESKLSIIHSSRKKVNLVSPISSPGWITTLARLWEIATKNLFPLLSTMVFSTRHRDYNDLSVQDLGDGQHGDGSDQLGGLQPFNLEAEFRKLHKLVKTQAKKIVALKRNEQLRKGKEKVVEEDPCTWLTKGPHLLMT
jgi:hypothetical protein